MRLLSVIKLNLSILYRSRRGCIWCSGSCTCPGLVDEPLLPRLLKLSPCSCSTMFCPDDRAASVPQLLGYVVVLPNTFGLPVAAEGKHPEHIVDQVEKALPKDENRGCEALVPRSEKARIRILEIMDRLYNNAIRYTSKGLHVCLERQELFNSTRRCWDKFEADCGQLFRKSFIICLEEPVAVDGVSFARMVPVHQRHRNPPLVSESCDEKSGLRSMDHVINLTASPSANKFMLPTGCPSPFGLRPPSARRRWAMQ